MIGFAEFGKLRLSQFLDPGEVDELEDWEYMERYWVGEACGFTEFLQLEDDPDVTRSIALDMEKIPDSTLQAILRALDLPLQPGMSLDRICQELRNEPSRTEVFAADRKTYEFKIGGERPYDISCTLLNDGGLVYLTIMQRDDHKPS